MRLFKHAYKRGIATALLALAMASGVATSAQAASVSEGVTVIPGTYLFDFDTGSLTTGPGADVWWEQITSTSRVLMPYSTAQLAYVGQVGVGGLSFNALTVSDLEALTYSSTGISGGDVGNLLTANSVFAVKTDAGNYGKVLVTFPFFQAYQNNGLGVYWVTMTPTIPVPEADTFSMLLAGFGLMASVVRRRSV
ncbi:PEP-CTERM sorting domain-containing protein [Methylophilus sp. UBA6697]|jgi:hypothetical protein|uniref:PEP-CTERM sorting domain-containing protein n=1 Tax=Methylophilus sp. UBA6697 TaxID=1946902 RepID=UPI000EC67CB3|nr:PEP-CTERM sorting domain-containing protein [Methylophilus sp. UBA6697]HCU85667.1 hypothetical protein [Methylophilus sp.]